MKLSDTGCCGVSLYPVCKEKKMNEILMEIKNISKFFPGVKALSDVSFNLYKGEARGFVGENGAGKSTLIKTIMGVYRQDIGTIDYHHDGKIVHIANPLDAWRKGVYAGYQDITVAPELSVMENFFMGKLPLRNGLVNWDFMYKESKKTLEDFGITNVDPAEYMMELSPSQQAMIIICKLVNEKPRMIIFDEPTAILTNEDCALLFSAINRLKTMGTSVLYITHRLEEIIKICDSVTVLKDGQYVGTYPANEMNEDKLITLMIGREIGDMYNITRAKHGKTILEVKNLERKDAFSDISFQIKQGEILGLFGLVGAGRTEIVRALFGIDPVDEGEIIIDEKRFRKMTPAKALRQGLALATEDRRNQGLSTMLSVERNINAASYDLISRLGIINLSSERKRAEEFTEKMRIKTPSIKQLVCNLSGGNQQKVVISKLLCREQKVLIFDEPTAGIDVGAKSEIYALIQNLAAQGKAIIVISSYMPELMGLSDRVIVIAGGRITGEIPRNEMNEEKLLKYASNL
jgi:ribose transport system ATP-binding protein